MTVFLDELIAPFYLPIGSGYKSAFLRGQVFWTHIGYSRELLTLWRPVSYDVSKTAAKEFEVVTAGGDAFRRLTPLQTPPLKTNEEFVAIIAKRRPVILLSPAPANPGIQALRYGGKIYRRMAIVVPVYSLFHRDTGSLKYPLQFVQSIRVLKFPEFLFMPPGGGVIDLPSYARVGELQAVQQPHLQPEDLRLSDEALKVLCGQLTFLTSGEYVENLASYREQLLSQG